MGKKASLLTIMMFLCIVSQAQSLRDSVYLFKSVIEQKCHSQDSGFYYHGGVAASDLSFIGLYKDALVKYDIPRKEEVVEISDSIKKYVNTLKATPAQKYIIDKAKKAQIIIVNEAHYNPRNRVFLTTLLQPLKNIGYTVFAAETFANDLNFEHQNHPTLHSGYYSCEPQFGNLIREAVGLGYKLLPYEDTLPNFKYRELNEAKNINVYLQSHPDAKIIIYCGFDHISENPLKNGYKTMASELKETTGIDPLTVNQVYLGERFFKNLERPERQLLNAADYTVFVDTKGNVLSGKNTDIAVYIPDTQNKYNRPEWIFENGKVPLFIPTNKITIDFPIMVKVYSSNDDIQTAIPIDVIEIENKSGLAKTALAIFPKRKYIIEVSNLKQEHLLFKIQK
ncbi:MAG: hypothetical protein QM610_05970 [Chitinophagaceae bacterium]